MSQICAWVSGQIFSSGSSVIPTEVAGSCRSRSGGIPATNQSPPTTDVIAYDVSWGSLNLKLSTLQLPIPLHFPCNFFLSSSILCTNASNFGFCSSVKNVRISARVFCRTASISASALS
jgi:hypothetical protein